MILLPTAVVPTMYTLRPAPALLRAVTDRLYDECRYNLCTIIVVIGKCTLEGIGFAQYVGDKSHWSLFMIWYFTAYCSSLQLFSEDGCHVRRISVDECDAAFKDVTGPGTEVEI